MNGLAWDLRGEKKRRLNEKEVMITATAATAAASLVIW